MKILAKIGTHSAQKIQVKSIRKAPKQGMTIQFKTYPYNRYADWQKGHIYTIKTVDNTSVYFIELM